MESIFRKFKGEASMNGTYLDKILMDKRTEVQKLKEASSDLHAVLNQPRAITGTFAKALKGEKLSVIAEIKRASPSKGAIGAIESPVHLAMKYHHGGVSAISILTDFIHFKGTLGDLKGVKTHFTNENIHVPLLRKDFLIHELQLAEAVLSGASAVLLIVNALGNNLKPMMDKATFLGLETLVEIHDEHDLELALEAGAKVIGVNNRDLKSFQVDLAVSERLRPKMPKETIAVAESGIHTLADAKRMREAGFDAVLVGEALVKADNPAAFIAAMRRV
jgi:indole-3-glycerol phosphate synthase